MSNNHRVSATERVTRNILESTAALLAEVRVLVGAALDKAEDRLLYEMAAHEEETAACAKEPRPAVKEPVQA